MTKQRSNFVLGLLSSAALCALAPAAWGAEAAVQTAAAAPATAPAVQIEEIVVTARRREENVQAVPIAIAVENHLTVDQVAHTLTIYPSLSGSIAEAARQLMHHEFE